MEEHSPGYQYGWVLLLLGATFIVMAAGPPDAWTRVLTVFLQGLTLLAALLASRVSRRLFRVAAVVPWCRSSPRSVRWSSAGRGEPTSVFFLLNILLVATVPWVIARSLWQRQVIDMRTVLGAICIYVLLGMMFAFVYAAINGLGNDAFFVQTNHADDARLPVLQLHHPDHRRVRRLHRRRRPRACARGHRGAHRSALPGDDHRRAGEPTQRAQRRDPHTGATRRRRPARPRRDRQDGVVPAAASGSAATSSRSRWSR